MLEIPAPSDIQGVERINGFVNYLVKFLPNQSDVLEPLWWLTRNDVEWCLGDDQEAAFGKVKELIATTPVLLYYDPAKKLTLQCDTCQNRLGLALMLEGQAVASARQALSDTERQ